MYHINTTEINKTERVSYIGGTANIENEYYPICPITQKPMLLLMTLRKDIFDTAFKQNNNVLEDDDFLPSSYPQCNKTITYSKMMIFA
ncbi:hypothetical protein ASG22_05685 [Chryseobacterium sp. Leaf405]|uniref:hypothetical protein n=1 Tax=Chryseobacterium sp. Leaf405 TaxID=1736367 RepID=UPI0006F95CB2|nr:hypothetical protein [Chryseobacterium sp. Leaf405]KQT26160.1 hypothetical protein ASG22_05685 [Chryseobacterium sp. Leaf405]